MRRRHLLNKIWDDDDDDDDDDRKEEGEEEEDDDNELMMNDIYVLVRLWRCAKQ